jgi:putative transposase
VAKRKHSEEQILAVVKQLEAGRTAAEMAREVGVSTFTIYSWKAKYGGLEPSEAARLRHLEDENSRLKRLVADLSLGREMLKALLIKNLWSAARLQAQALMKNESAQIYPAYLWAEPWPR